MGHFFGATKRNGWSYHFLMVLFSVLVSACTGSSVPTDTDEDPVASAQSADQSDTGPQQGQDDGGAISGAPEVSVSADSYTISEGGDVTLSWSASGADSCSASGGWNGQVNASGTQQVGPLTAGTTFGLSCSGPGGTTLEMLSVAVVGPVALSWDAPDENVDGSPLVDLAGYKIYYGEASRDYTEEVEITDNSATDHTLNLASGNYYVAMTAFDSEGHESNYSNEVLRSRP